MREEDIDIIKMREGVRIFITTPKGQMNKSLQLTNEEYNCLKKKLGHELMFSPTS